MLKKKESQLQLARFATTSRMLLNYDKDELDFHKFGGHGHCVTCLLREIADTFTDNEEIELRFKSEGMIFDNEKGWHFPRKYECDI